MGNCLGTPNAAGMGLISLERRGGGTVAEWSEALLERNKINENQKRFQVRPPGRGNLQKDNLGTNDHEINGL